MSRFASISYTQHAIERIKQRRISENEVEVALGIGEGRPDDDGTWVYELRTIHRRGLRVIVFEDGGVARVKTVMRMRKTR